MKEDREEGSLSSCVEDWDLGILGGRAEYFLIKALVLLTIITFFRSNSLTKIISTCFSLELIQINYSYNILLTRQTRYLKINIK